MNGLIPSSSPRCTAQSGDDFPETDGGMMLRFKVIGVSPAAIRLVTTGKPYI
jgi:hypothetical protein